MNFNEMPKIETIQLSELYENYSIDMLRLDALHPVVSGNKFYKLRNYITEFLEQNKWHGIATMGGGYSNHLVATAFYCNQKKIPSIGIVRGDYSKNITPTIQNCINQNMTIIYVEKLQYTMLNKVSLNSHYFYNKKKYKLISEGGYGTQGALGLTELFESLGLQSYTHIVLPVGTGTTLAGIMNAKNILEKKVIGIVCTKNNSSIQNEIEMLLDSTVNKINMHLLHDFHFGGFAKKNEELVNFIILFFKQYQIKLDHVYTAKAMLGFLKWATKKLLPGNNKILFVHTGGLQGTAETIFE